MIKHKILYKLENNISDNYKLDLSIKTCKDKINNILDFEKHHQLMDAKNKIDNYYNIKQWDKVKKIINPYELIYITNKKNRKLSVSNYEPLSRSYYKILEISKMFFKDTLNQPSIISCHLAEGPGGFMEGLINIRKNPFDILYGITLIDQHKEVPGWKRINQILQKNKNIKILLGYDNTGDLYKTINHKYLYDTIGNKCDLITADGGFDFSVDYNLQEFLAQKLIYSEVISALGIQKKGGNFVCKFFDINSLLTIEIIYILQVYYQDIYIFKPLTSRPANSEKYIICKNFKGIDNKMIEQLKNILEIWNILDNKNVTMSSILKNIDGQFVNSIIEINKKIIDEQINTIDKTIHLIQNPFTYNETQENYKYQIKCSQNWCKLFDV